MTSGISAAAMIGKSNSMRLGRRRRGLQQVLPIHTREDLLHSVAQAGFGAGLHLRLFDNPGPVLHLDADPRAFVFVNRMAHTETAPAAWFVLRQLRRGAGQGQRGENKAKHCGRELPFHISKDAQYIRLAPMVQSVLLGVAGNQVTEVILNRLISDPAISLCTLRYARRTLRSKSLTAEIAEYLSSLRESGSSEEQVEALQFTCISVRPHLR